jgi:hypothetical protein
MCICANDCECANVQMSKCANGFECTTMLYDSIICTLIALHTFNNLHPLANGYIYSYAH